MESQQNPRKKRGKGGRNEESKREENSQYSYLTHAIEPREHQWKALWDFGHRDFTHHQQRNIRLTANYTTATMEARTQLNTIFNLCRMNAGNNCLLWMLYPSELSFDYEGKTKVISRKT